MKQVTIISNGNLSDFSHLRGKINKDSFIICADGGAKQVIEYGFLPNIVVGDMDSIDAEMLKLIKLKKIQLLTFPTKKDKTDFELAVDFALYLKPQTIQIFGLLGDRIDHFVGNILLLKKICLEHKTVQLIAYEGNKTIYFIHNTLTITGKVGDQVSVVPLTNIFNMTLDGFEYPLKNTYIQEGTTRTISNTLKRNKGTITFQKGIAMVMYFPCLIFCILL